MIDEMKMCLICKQSKEYPYPENGVHSFGQHFTLGKTWRPSVGHPDYQLHVKVIKLFKIDEKVTR
jgi:hypothetical protein